MSETIALFGGTGATGKHFLQLALEAGYKVRALVRTPTKVTITDNNLTLIEGSFTDTEKVEETIQGATYVVSMAGAPIGFGQTYPKDMMVNFTRLLVPAMKKAKTKVFLYQAGAFSLKMDGTRPLLMAIMGTIIGGLMGMLPLVNDNGESAKYLNDAENLGDLNVIMTHPGMLKDEPSSKKLVAKDEVGVMRDRCIHFMATPN